MDYGRKPEFPKPFDFVPFAERVEKQRRVGHDRFDVDQALSGQLLYDLTVQTPLHVSSGSYALTDRDMGMEAKAIVRDCYKVTVNGALRPAVPGSTLKGATRAIVEAVTHSCIGITRVEAQSLPADARRACRPPQLCPACSLYGAMSQLGRLSFSDAVFVKGDAVIMRMPALFRPRPRQGRAYRDNAGDYQGRKFYFHGRPQKHQDGTYIEALKPNTVLRGAVEFSRLTEAELGLLCFALGLDGSFALSLGGGKPAAMGRVTITPTAIYLRQSASFTAYEEGDVPLTETVLASAIERYLQAAQPLILMVQRDKLRQILRPDNPRPAPTGVY